LADTKISPEEEMASPPDEIQSQTIEYQIQVKGKSRWRDYLASIRYLIIRTIGCPVPFLQNWIPILGGRTLIELVMIAVACVVTIPQALSDFKGAGTVADYLMMITIVLGFRNNVLTYILGMSFERVIYWHKLIAVLTVVVTIIHAFEGMNLSGLLIILTVGVMGLAYMIKPYFFEGFYYVHVTSVVLLMVFGFLHFAKVYQFVCIVWFADIALRYVVTMKKVSAVATLLPGDVIKIKFPNCFNYHCGQYCFLMVKEISPFDFHPFSLSSTPEEENTAFHIRELGGWTRKLAKHIREEHQRQNPNWTVDSPIPISIPLEVYVEGPYGNKMIDVENPNYEVSVDCLFLSFSS
jgi:predicted ferric reductase